MSIKISKDIRHYTDRRQQPTTIVFDRYNVFNVREP
jgi:hypothetical protein